MSKSRPHKISQQVIEDLLKTAPRSNEELCKLMGFSRCGIRVHLERMEIAGQIHRKRSLIDRASGFCFIWHIGPRPDDELAPILPAERPMRGATPRQKTVQAYPLISRRDDLVAALFGPARKEIA